MRFRGHHLVCLHFYRGEGYDQKFIDNLTALVERAESGEIVEVVSGPDDVCRCCPYLQGKRCFHQGDSEEEIRQLDEKALNFFKLKPGQQVTWRELKNRLVGAQEWLQDFCFGCSWAEVCKNDGESGERAFPL